MAGAKALVNAVLKSGMPVAVATSANRKAFELKVDYCDKAAAVVVCC